MAPLLCKRRTRWWWWWWLLLGKRPSRHRQYVLFLSFCSADLHVHRLRKGLHVGLLMLTLRLFDQKQSVSTTIREDFDITRTTKRGEWRHKTLYPAPSTATSSKKKKKGAKQNNLCSASRPFFPPYADPCCRMSEEASEVVPLFGKIGNRVLAERRRSSKHRSSLRNACSA